MSDAAKSNKTLKVQSASTDVHQLSKAQLEQIAGGGTYHSHNLEGEGREFVETCARNSAAEYTTDPEAAESCVASFISNWAATRWARHRIASFQFGDTTTAIKA